MGQPGRKPKVVLGDVLEVFESREDRAEPLIASEIAEKVGCSRKTAYNKLRALEENGTLASKKVGGRSRVYWVPILEDGEDEPGFSDSENNHPMSDGEESISEGGSESLAGIDFPAGRDRSECEAAIYAARDYLRDDGPASMREIVIEVMPAYSLGYDVPDLGSGDRYRGSWWRKIVKPGLDALEGVEYRENHGNYRYIGDSEP